MIKNADSAKPLPFALHVVPVDGIGGVEVAAQSIADGQHGRVRFEKLYLMNKNIREVGHLAVRSNYQSKNDPRVYVSAARRILLSKPDLLIASLWRSCLVLLIVKLLRPGTKAVTFLHSASNTHWLGALLHGLAMFVSKEIWADSQTTLDARVPTCLLARAKVISFLSERLQPSQKPRRKASFVFYGRLHRQKNLNRALKIFAAICKIHPYATFDIIGPDAGDRAALEQESISLGMQNRVIFHGAMARDKLFPLAGEMAFYLQTSVTEGMAMSVIEAMQLGLVPVVTPVGEISCYCRDRVNAILVDDDAGTVQKVLELINTPTLFQAMSESAAATWTSQPLYSSDLLAACDGLLAGG